MNLTLLPRERIRISRRARFPRQPGHAGRLGVRRIEEHAVADLHVVTHGVARLVVAHPFPRRFACRARAPRSCMPRARIRQPVAGRHTDVRRMVTVGVAGAAEGFRGAASCRQLLGSRQMMRSFRRSEMKSGHRPSPVPANPPCRSRPALGPQPSAAVTLQARFTGSSPARSRCPARTAARTLRRQIWEHSSKDHALPSRAVPVLGGRARLERATRRGVSLSSRCTEAHRSRKTGAAILAASPVSVIRVDPT